MGHARRKYLETTLLACTAALVSAPLVSAPVAVAAVPSSVAGVDVRGGSSGSHASLWPATGASRLPVAGPGSASLPTAAEPSPMPGAAGRQGRAEQPGKHHQGRAGVPGRADGRADGRGGGSTESDSGGRRSAAPVTPEATPTGAGSSPAGRETEPDGTAGAREEESDAAAWRPAPVASELTLAEADRRTPEETLPGNSTTAAPPAGPVLPVLTLGAGMTSLGLGLAFIALRLRRG